VIALVGVVVGIVGMTRPGLPWRLCPAVAYSCSNETLARRAVVYCAAAVIVMLMSSCALLLCSLVE